jgi:hypothetical protein
MHFDLDLVFFFTEISVQETTFTERAKFKMRIQSIMSLNTTYLVVVFCLLMKVSQFSCASIDASDDELRKSKFFLYKIG